MRSRASALLVAACFVAGCNAASATAAEVPPVLLTEEHAAQCLVKVGDALPKITLPDLSGKEQQLPKLYGKRGTVLIWFHLPQPMSAAMLADVQAEVVKPFAEKGVNAVGIAVGHEADTARKAVAKAEARIPVLLDTQRKAFAQIAKKKLPRIYVLDADGKIVWFDLEYSEATRRELRQTLEVLTKE